jgi:hypothetical protein
MANNDLSIHREEYLHLAKQWAAGPLRDWESEGKKRFHAVQQVFVA